MSFRGALVKKAADQTAANYSGAPVIAWDSEVYDTESLHDTVTQNSRITIPARLAGQYALFTACVSVSSVAVNSRASLQVNRNSSAAFLTTVATRGMTGNGQATTSNWMQITTPPILLTASDFYEAVMQNEDTSITVESESSFGIWFIDNYTDIPAERVLATLNANSTGDFSTPTAIPFDGTDAYDTHAIHSNNTKLIIPSALNNRYAVIGASVKVDTDAAVSSTYSVVIRKNGSITYDGVGGNSASNGATYTGAQISAFTQPIQVSTGDEFECLFYCSDTSVTLLASATTFGLRVVG